MRELPMFPLGSVLLPHMVLPLHVFEPRYRRLMQDLTAPGSDGLFGVSLIERGHEVGGFDTRAATGCVARLLETQELEDGRWVAIAVGTRRLQVVEWLPDDPYPRAVVEELADPPATEDDRELRREVAVRLRRVLALQAELDEPAVPATTELHDDPLTASYQASVLAPLGPLDRYHLLAAPTAGARLRLLADRLDDAAEVLDLRLQSGEG